MGIKIFKKATSFLKLVNKMRGELLTCPKMTKIINFNFFLHNFGDSGDSPPLKWPQYYSIIKRTLILLLLGFIIYKPTIIMTIDR